MSPEDRLPIHDRGLALFLKGYPIDTAELVARSELTEQQRQNLDANERFSTPPGKMTGFERNG